MKIKNKHISIKIIKKIIKYNNINIYILCFTLILSMQFFLSGCASNSLFRNSSASTYNIYNNGYNNGESVSNGSGDFLEKNENLKKALENSVLYYSLKLNKVSGRKIKNLERSEKYGHNGKIKQTGLNNGYIVPSFMKEEHGITDKIKKNTKNYAYNATATVKIRKAKSAKEVNKNVNTAAAANASNQKEKEITPIFIKLSKTAKADDGKIVLNINGIQAAGNLEIISFSLSNFYKLPLRYKPLLFEKSGKNKYIEIPFKSNIKKQGGKNYFILSGFSKIKGKLICISKDIKSGEKSALRKTVLFIEALYKNDYGGIRFIKLPVKL